MRIADEMSGLRLPSGDGCDFPAGAFDVTMLRARTHIDAMGKWIEFEMRIHHWSEHCNSAR